METIFEIVQDTENRLDRKLQTCEVEFLEWVLFRYKKEEKEKVLS